jgi:hypothetical protein
MIFKFSLSFWFFKVKISSVKSQKGCLFICYCYNTFIESSRDHLMPPGYTSGVYSIIPSCSETSIAGKSCKCRYIPVTLTAVPRV